MVRRLPNLDQLRAFEAAARHLSFTRAGEELHVTQAAISHRIRALEEDLGAPLFRRQVRRVSLDPRAEPLAAALTKALAGIEDAVSAFAAAGLTGTLKLSVAPFFGNRVFLPLLPAFHGAYPGLTVQPHMATEMIDLVTSDFDGALRYGNGDWPGLGAIRVLTDRMAPMAAAAAIGGRTLPLSPAEIADLTLSSSGDGTADWQRWFAAAGAEVDRPLNVMTYSTRAGSTDMALSGLGVALCETRLVQEDLAAGRLVQLHPQTIPAAKSMYLVHPGPARPDPRLICLADWLVEALTP